MDPVGFLQGGTNFFNRYVYTLNNPVNLIDPDGLCSRIDEIQSCPGSYENISYAQPNEPAEGGGGGRNIGPDFFRPGDSDSPFELTEGEARRLDPLNIGVENVPNIDEIALISEALELIDQGIPPGVPTPYENWYTDSGALLPWRFAPYVKFDIPSPNSDSRGQRRLIVGQGAVFYSNTHYDHFVPIVE